MEPIIFRKMVQHYDLSQPVVAKNVPMYVDTLGNRIQDSGLSVESLGFVANMGQEIHDHIADSDIHLTAEDKADIMSATHDFESHMTDSVVHITETERQTWNDKETTEGSQTKANIVQSNLNAHINNTDVHVTLTDKQKWNNSYTKEEIDNKFSMIEFNNDWKEAVQTFDDLFIVYPDPYEGWTVNVLDTGITYRFNGTEWVGISANVIPLATPELDGLMSKTDKAKLDNIEEFANNYIHPDDDNTKHVSVEQIAYWNDKADKTLVNYNDNGLMSKEDKYKLDGIEEGATNYVEPETFPATKIEEDANHRFCTDDEKTYWSNKANNNLVSANLDGLMSKEDKYKLDSIDFDANYYVHPEFHYPTIIQEDENHRFVTDEQIESWNSKAGAGAATGETDGLMTAADKAKLDGIEERANNYTHPEHHTPDIITQDTNNRFVTDAQIERWDGKKDADDFFCGQSIFNSTDGVTINHNMTGINFAFFYTITGDPTNVGTVTIQKTPTSVIVYNSGTAKDVTFDFTLIKYYQ